MIHADRLANASLFAQFRRRCCCRGIRSMCSNKPSSACELAASAGGKQKAKSIIKDCTKEEKENKIYGMWGCKRQNGKRTGRK